MVIHKCLEKIILGIPSYFQWLNAVEPGVMASYKAMQRALILRQIPISGVLCIFVGVLEMSTIFPKSHGAVAILLLLAFLSFLWPVYHFRMARTAWRAAVVGSVFRTRLRWFAALAFSLTLVSLLCLGVIFLLFGWNAVSAQVPSSALAPNPASQRTASPFAELGR